MRTIVSARRALIGYCPGKSGCEGEAEVKAIIFSLKCTFLKVNSEVRNRVWSFFSNVRLDGSGCAGHGH